MVYFLMNIYMLKHALDRRLLSQYWNSLIQVLFLRKLKLPRWCRRFLVPLNMKFDPFKLIVFRCSTEVDRKPNRKTIGACHSTVSKLLLLVAIWACRVIVWYIYFFDSHRLFCPIWTGSYMTPALVYLTKKLTVVRATTSKLWFSVA